MLGEVEQFSILSRSSAPGLFSRFRLVKLTVPARFRRNIAPSFTSFPAFLTTVLEIVRFVTPVPVIPRWALLPDELLPSVLLILILSRVALVTLSRYTEP